MRRSICQCEPKLIRAGETNTWKFIYTTANSLPKGTKIKFDLDSNGKPSDWQIPQVNPKNKSNLIWAELPNEKMIAATPVENPNKPCCEYEFVLPIEIKPLEKFTVCIGSPTGDSKEQGTRAQQNVQRRRCFNLLIDTKGKGDYKEKEVFQMDIKGNILKKMRIIIPSVVTRNKRFDIIVRFEDVFGNLTNFAPDGTLIELTYDHLRENLNWKLFVPETGFLTLPNLYFNEPGIYKIKLQNLLTKEVFYSPPIKCFEDNDINLFWGLLHGECEKSDSVENLDTTLRYFRDEKAHHFFAISPCEYEERPTNEQWKQMSSQIAEFNEDERFTTFLGFQWKGETKKEGMRQIVYAKDQKPLQRQKDLKSSSLSKIYKSFQPKELISIPISTMSKENPYSFDDFNPDFERVVEIYNAWGSSECLEKENNLRPLLPLKKKGSLESAEGSIQQALLNNCRFGFVAGGFDDRGAYEDCFETHVQYSPGLTGIYAKDHTRASIIDALYNRSCYATTGKKIIIGLYVAQKPMGSELDTGTKPGLEMNRHLSGFAIGTDTIREICLIRNGKVIHTYHPNNYQMEFEFDDLEPLKKVVLKEKHGKPPFVYYYMRVIQNDGHIAWSSPIWVDQTSTAAVKKIVKKKG